MEAAFSIVVGTLFAISVYLLLSGSLIRLLLGIFVLGNATHLLIFVAGRLVRHAPPLIPDGLEVADTVIANPLPQALILTAIVISFSLFSFLLVLAYRAYQCLDTVNTDEMRDAEPIVAPNVLRGRDV
ncbi:MAG: Na+/H+ antiporter subunit C [Rhodospirillales bacterium]|nr:Na+/H+ antiporter subunit C [Rhodospirillales bacterium]